MMGLGNGRKKALGLGDRKIAREMVYGDHLQLRQLSWKSGNLSLLLNVLCIAIGWIPHSSSSYHYHAFRWGDMFQRLQRAYEHSVCEHSIVRLPTEFMGMGRKNFQTNPHDVC